MILKKDGSEKLISNIRSVPMKINDRSMLELRERFQFDVKEMVIVRGNAAAN
jgi:hypothetical protein